MEDGAGVGELLGTVDDIDYYLGSSYLFKEVDSTRLYRVYNDLVGGVDKGLCVSRTFPKKVRAQNGVEKGTFLWMTSNTVGHDHCVSPTNISMLHMAMSDFLRKVGRGIITIEGVEYLISNNGFDPILRLLHTLNDRVAVSSHLVLVTLDEATLEPREMRILEKDFELAL